MYGQKYNYNLEVFTNEDSISYYLLGVFITDGHVTIRKGYKTAHITSKDKLWLELIASIICPNKPLSPSRNAWVLTINNTKICDWLISKGCYPAKSLTIKFPHIPNIYIHDFIRGCWDGDGCICVYKAKSRKNLRVYSYIASASEQFIISIFNILQQKEINCSIHKLKLCGGIIDGRKIIAKNHLHKVHLSDQATVKLIEFIYYDNCLCLDRKRIKSEEVLRQKK